MKTLFPKILIVSAIAHATTIVAQPLYSDLRISLYQGDGKSVDLLKGNNQSADAYHVKCFTREHLNKDNPSPDDLKNNTYHNHDILLKVPCSKKDSGSYELLCYSFSVSFYDVESIKLVIDQEQDSMVIYVNNIPAPVPVSDIVIDPLVFNPGKYVIDFKDIEKNRFERISAADTLRNRNICNSCFLLNGSVHLMGLWMIPELDAAKLLVIVNSRTIRKINTFEKFLNVHDMLLSENSPSNADKSNLNKYLIIKRKDGGLFAADNCPQLEIIRKNKRHVKFAGQLMHYDHKGWTGVAYTNYMTVRIKKTDLASFKLLIESKRLTINEMYDQPDKMLMLEMTAENTVGAEIQNIADDLKRSGLAKSVDMLFIEASPVSDMGAQ